MPGEGPTDSHHATRVPLLYATPMFILLNRLSEPSGSYVPSINKYLPNPDKLPSNVLGPGR